MSAIDILMTRLRALNVKIKLENDQLSVRAPKGVLTQDLANELKANKEAVIQFLRQAEAQVERQSAREIERINRNEALPLSFGQQRLWFLDRLEGPSSTYNMPLAIRLHGNLNIEAAQYAINAIVDRHEALRANFQLHGQAPYVTIRSDSTCPILIVHSDQSQSIEVQISEQVKLASNYCFDLANELLIRVNLVKLSDQSSLLIVTMHHIVSDGWSLGLFIKEFTQLYQDKIDGIHTSLSPLNIQYVDYAQWQRHTLQGESLNRLLNFWTKNLLEAPERIDLPTDKPRPAIMSYRGQSKQFELPSKLMTALGELSHRNGSTLFMTLLSGFSLLMRRMSGQQDLMIATTVANRRHADIESLIGLFINTLALRIQVNDSISVEKFLGEIKNICLHAFEHQDLPFEQLVEAINPPRSLSYAPLVQVSFDVQNTPSSQLVMGDLRLESINIPVTSSKFDLSLSIEVEADKDIAVWTWNPDLFSEDTIQRLMGHFTVLLGSIAEDQTKSITDLPLDNQDILSSVSSAYANNAPKPFIQTWLDLFDEQVQKTPEKIAIRFGESSLTFKNLQDKVARLASGLRGSGVTTETKVAILIERSINMVVALLATMRAGGTYIPLDPNYPEERLKWVLEDAKPLVILTEQSLHSKVISSDALVYCLDSQIDQARLDDAAIKSEDLPPLQIFDLNTAYVIFTSGSTGRPKGVQVTHAGLLNFLLSMRSKPGLSQNHTLLAVTTISFDIAALEIYLPLITGAELVIAPREVALNAEALQQLISLRGVTHMQSTPTAWRLLLDTHWSAPANFTILCGGEALPRDLSRQLLALDIKLWNLYGPTETTIWSAAKQVVLSEEYEMDGCEPVGAPIRNTQIYTLDERLNCQPIGFSGELVIGGDGLARGYLNRPDLTADQYRPDPFSPIPGARIYRTGDLARARSDETYEFLGRIDSQIKIRGYRIELGEIETCLRQVADLVEAIVIAREDTPGDKRLVAYVLPQSGVTISEQSVRTALKQRIPDYMVPAHIMVLDHLPQTPNGKIDRKALPKPEIKSAPLTPQLNDKGHDGNRTELAVLEIWRGILGRNEIGLDENFFDIGGHSLLLTRVYEELKEQYGGKLSLITLFQFPTIRTLATALSNLSTSKDKQTLNKPIRKSISQDIAVIGMSGRFPGSHDLDAFWINLLEGKESIQFFSLDELIAAGVDPSEAQLPNYVPAHGRLDEIEYFDAEFFGYTPLEAKIIDPQQRLFLQTAWHTLEHAGYAKNDPSISIGVFAGCSQNDYLINQILPHSVTHTDVTAYQAILGNDKDFIATRVSYALNLTGPSLNIQTACSTSLVAVHAACRSILDDECDLAIAGGAGIRVPQTSGHMYEEGMITSPDGHCRAFDTNAQGTVWGSGVGAILLKRLDQAIADQDTIHAVIKGTAINNDGSMKVGFTAPSVQGQTEVIRQAQRRAHVSADQIAYIEAHGTGTALGDLIEVGALNNVFGGSTFQPQTCAIGSVKTNIGHLNSAAGIAGLTKAILTVKHGKIPPTLHFTAPNPKFDLQSTPFYINSDTIDWPASHLSRIAGVSSFGIGGTNAHAIVAQAPIIQRPEASRLPRLLVLSARSTDALNTMRQQLSAFLSRHDDIELADVAWTLASGRKSFPHRLALSAETIKQAIEKLEDKTNCFTHSLDKNQISKPRVVFMFPGQGSQFVGMAEHLYKHEQAFKTIIDECAGILLPILKVDIRTIAFNDPTKTDQHFDINETWLTQPVLFAIEYALAKLWMSYGVVPDAMIGHSLGEYVAATLSGVFDLPTALNLVSTRGKLIWNLDRGAMLAIALDADQAKKYMTGELSLAAINSSDSCVIAGPFVAIDALAVRLEQDGIIAKKLQTSHAFHSSMLDPALTEFDALLKTLNFKAPTTPFVSNLTGGWITSEQAMNTQYWVDHMRQAVLFNKGLDTVLENNDTILLEVGPGAVLSSLARKHVLSKNIRTIVQSLPPAGTAIHTDDASLAWFDNLAKSWCAGIEFDWANIWPDERRARIPLPVYPFNKVRHWIDVNPQDLRHHGSTALIKQPLENWFYMQDWEQTQWPAPASQADLEDSKLVTLYFSDEGSLSKHLISNLTLQGHRVIKVLCGQTFKKISSDEFLICPESFSDYTQLFSSIGDTHIDYVVHTWLLADSNTPYTLGARSLEQIATKIGTSPDIPTKLTFISRPTQNVTGSDDADPYLAAARGIVKVVAQEIPDIHTQCIDIDVDNIYKPSERLIQGLIADITRSETNPSINYRHARRYVEKFRSISVPESKNTIPLNLKRNGVYWITGGLGRMGLRLAKYLAIQTQAKLVLISRRAANTEQLEQIAALKQLGADVISIVADVANQNDMASALKTTLDQFFKLDGIIHAAGSPSAIAFLDKDQPQIDSPHFQSKIEGCRILHETVKDLKLDFVALMSSTSSILGGLGFAEYSASNIYMDAFADQISQKSPYPWVSINWDAWDFDDQTESSNQSAAFWMKANEAIEVFARIMDQPLTSQIIVASADISQRYEFWLKPRENSFDSSDIEDRLGSDSDYSNATDTERLLATIWCELLGYKQVGMDDDFFELGGDSMLGIRLVTAISHRLGRKLPPTLPLEYSTIRKMASAIDEKQQNENFNPLVKLQNNGKMTSFFCVPGTGGSVLYLNELARQLEKFDHSFFGLQALGLDGSTTPLDRIEDIAKINIKALRGQQPEGPYSLGGHSFGSWVALEMARQLEQQGHTVERLVILDTAVPSSRDLSHMGGWDNTRWLLNVADTIGQMYGKSLGLSEDNLKGLNWDDQVATLAKKLIDHGLIAPTDDISLVRGLVEVFKTQAQIKYNPPNDQKFSLVLIRAEEPMEIFLEGMPESMRADPAWGWKAYAKDVMDLEITPGNHLTMVAHPHVQRLSELIAKYI